AWWTLAAGFAATAGLTWTLLYEAVELDRQRFLRRADEIQSHLDAQLEKSEMLLNNLGDFLRFSGENRSAILDRWCYDNGLTINCPWLLGVVVATNLHTPRWRDRFPNPPGAWTYEDWGNLKNFMEKQPVECEIAMKTSVTNTLAYLSDYQLRSFGHHQDHFAKTVMGSRIGMSPRRYIMVEANTNGIIGTLYYLPLYTSDLAPLMADVQAVRKTTWGDRAPLHWLHFEAMVVAPVSFDLLAETLRNGKPLDVELEIFSSTNQTAKTWLSNASGSPKAIDPTFRPYLKLRHTWPMYGDRFSLFLYTTPLFEAQSARRLARTAGWAGVAISLLATALVGVSVRARNRQDHLTGQIREARDALAAAQRERDRISRDLHDGTIQSLYAIQLGLGHTAVRLRSEPDHAGSELSAVRRELNAVIAEIRRFIATETAGETPKPVDLGAVLQALVQRARGGTTSRIELSCDREASARVTGDQAVQLANIAREALSNALRHGRPREVDIVLRLEGEFVVLEIADDGVGFTPEASGGSGLGLVSMRTRAAEADGTLVLDSSPGRGTRVVVKMPVGADESVEPERPEAPDEEA
ncbi:MAG: sensor histidine kinase, partial [Verrucomicrobiales bacterium]|nr:sensor histidine kinase [Verrucomicrobiales bacterium]